MGFEWTPSAPKSVPECKHSQVKFTYWRGFTLEPYKEFFDREHFIVLVCLPITSWHESELLDIVYIYIYMKNYSLIIIKWYVANYM